jgi:serine/threonine-protein kinase
VLSISWADASAFAKWKSAREGHLYCLPHEVQWEKAARGPDARVYPWGIDMDQRLCNMNTTHNEGPHPVAVGTFPLDESPYGVRDLGGNARDWCLNDPGDPQHSSWRVMRGGNWHNPAPASRACYRAAAPLRALQPMNSFRLSVALRVPGETAPRT